ncbi:phosphoenolpyruvate--protein phosphotransferase [Haematospirillum sp. H1815]|uniref:phosphoenolpyruvate--protein phosphotransferase n=1 Tax=Haematospirillum sp. H1815 TaxID=2723108 RepID=UPI00143A73EB|nr:phosphoenolpyruvate--protein phosphotransferase [Haematospirillum sp. H1815]NKD76623.1 phosphoenolpyruvate--protein phosphotransferase [Haematospirillum sp. H1815]
MSKIEVDADVARRLLSRLRDVLAGDGDAQSRLDGVAMVIADSLQAEVCSIYVMRAGEVLELFATEGLNQSAVHQTRLRVAEGLVGDVAARGRSLSLADAWQHPSFVYRPETGEDLFHSFVGVPIIRGSRVIGVLVVQNRDTRVFSDLEIETLETVTMVLAELIGSSDLVSRDELMPADGIGLLPLRLDGLTLAPGIGIGTVVLHEPRRSINDVVAEDPECELHRLHEALQTLRAEVDTMMGFDGVSGDSLDILRAYRMFAQDKGWIGRISDAVRSGLTAEAAVMRVHDDTRMRMHQVSDPYLRERLHDLEDLANRLLRHLAGEDVQDELPEDAVLVCRNLGPTELLDYDRSRLCGLVMEEGSRTMHAVIVARALGIPVVGRVDSVFSMVESGDSVIVDGEHGQVFIRPSEDICQQFEESLCLRQHKLEAWAQLRTVPAVSRDGVTVNLMLNAGLLLDLPHLEETGASGIGLYRTELPFMSRPALPDVAVQRALYSRILDYAGPERPVVFRTLDVGSDKVLPYWHSTREENPALGWRSVRISMDRPAIFLEQLQALVQAAHGRVLCVMFPMISTVEEFCQARQLLDMELSRQGAAGFVPSAVRVGTMLEVPSLLWELPALLDHVDFLSIGTNDLSQFLFATDRGNPSVADRYDVLSPPFLKVVRQVIRACADAGVACSVCGEMAGRPLEAVVLAALGVQTLSMSASGVGPVKAAVRDANLGDLAGYLDDLLNLGYRSLRERLRGYARDHGISLP